MMRMENPVSGNAKETAPSLADLRMEYRRPWGMQTPAEKVLTYTVKVEK